MTQRESTMPIPQWKKVKIQEPKVTPLGCLTALWLQWQLSYHTASFLLLLFNQQVLCYWKARKVGKAIAGKLLTWWTGSLEHNLPRGSQKAQYERVERNEQYLNSLYSQHTGSFPPLQLLSQSCAESHPCCSCQLQQPSAGKLYRRNLKKNKNEFLLWNLGEEKK